MAEDEWVGVTEDQVLSILELRRKRSATFGEALFSDPAWDILLEVFAAKLGRRRISLSDLSPIAPPSTLARWTAALLERGILVCNLSILRPDQMWIELTPDWAAKMMRFLGAARHLGHPR